MKLQILVTLVATLTVAADPPKENPAKELAAKLEGTWEVVSEGRAEDIPPEFRRTHMIVKGDQLTFVMPKRKTVFEFWVDPFTKPMSIDFKSVEGELKGRVSEGIFELDGDNLKICSNYRAVKGGRPTMFVTDTDLAGTRVIVLKRAKP